MLAVYAHPDDPEVSCGGTLARWATAGADISLVIATRGEKGSADAGVDPEELATRRADEVAAAADVLGVARHTQLAHPDGELDNTSALREVLVARIRSERPDVVLAPDPTAVFFGSGYVNHRDHRELGWAVLDACCPASSSPLYFPGTGGAHQVATILLSGTLEPDTWGDVGATLDRKAEALACHASQLGDGSAWVADVVADRAAEAGHDAGLAHAESYRRVQLT